MKKGFFSFVLSLILILSLSFSSYASTNTENVIDDNSSIVQIYEEGMEITELEEGIFEVKFPLIKTEKSEDIVNQSVAVGSITFTLYGYTNNIQNLYNVVYVIRASEPVNGIMGNLTITNTSILFPTTYFQQSINRSFPATTLYYGDAGNVVIPYEVKQVRLNFRNSRMYFLSYGWTSGINLSSLHNVN
ncbi:hypothetical protein EDC18_103143 [Natranaerovirga pectinivora]|uniref:DUF5626 domain-containing protein n=1 Tax=Natranaerovirga pectinivora TaxID=682400 RepID=A0A4R3MLD1_9FIRM|nr:hypothetical protein [Natranaerovirga pectinivora]TCT15438.1 hypothetical protein EDC18_103143 [Natranaerovirga pectinivora]